MALSKIIQPHYTAFCEAVRPFSLASRLSSLTRWDLDAIQCQEKSGRLYGIHELCNSMYGKVRWQELYNALIQEKLNELAETLLGEYYRQNPAARRQQSTPELNSGAMVYQREDSHPLPDSTIHCQSPVQTEAVPNAGNESRVATRRSSSSDAETQTEKTKNDVSTTTLILNVQVGNGNTMAHYQSPNAGDNETDGGNNRFEVITESAVLPENEVSEALNNKPTRSSITQTCQRVSAQVSSNIADGEGANISCNGTGVHLSGESMSLEAQGHETIRKEYEPSEASSLPKDSSDHSALGIKMRDTCSKDNGTDDEETRLKQQAE